jgi:hypothetical protein
MGMANEPKPIYSTLGDNTRLHEAISKFVIALAEIVDSLQDAERSGDLQVLRTLAETTGREADTLGYACLTEQTDLIREACIRDKPELAQAALMDLTALCTRIRLGHRGAA